MAAGATNSKSRRTCGPASASSAAAPAPRWSAIRTRSPSGSTNIAASAPTPSSSRATRIWRRPIAWPNCCCRACRSHGAAGASERLVNTGPFGEILSGGAAMKRVTRPTIAIVGGGFSGAAVAFHLARAAAPCRYRRIRAARPARRRPRLWRRRSRSSCQRTRDAHVAVAGGRRRISRAGSRLQAFSPAIPLRSLAMKTPSRAGANLDAMWRRRCARISPRRAVRHVRDEVASLRRARGVDGACGRSLGETFRADIAVIATTHPDPDACRRTRRLSRRSATDCRSAGRRRRQGRRDGDERVLIVGAGLTAADSSRRSTRRGHRGRIVDDLAPGPSGARPLAAPARARGRISSRIRPAHGVGAVHTVRPRVRRAEASGPDLATVIDGVRSQGPRSGER